MNNCLHHLSKVGPDHPCFCSLKRPWTLIWHCTCHIKYSIYIDLNHFNKGGKTRLGSFSFLFCFNTKSRSHSIIHPCHVGSISQPSLYAILTRKKKGIRQSAKFLYPAVKPLYDVSMSLNRLTPNISSLKTPKQRLFIRPAMSLQRIECFHNLEIII